MMLAAMRTPKKIVGVKKMGEILRGLTLTAYGQLKKVAI
jgi:hypothetical protein